MQMKRLRSIVPITVVALLAIGGACVTSGCKGSDVVVRSAQSTSGDSACIVAYMDSVLGSYAADLILSSTNGRVDYHPGSGRTANAGAQNRSEHPVHSDIRAAPPLKQRQRGAP